MNRRPVQIVRKIVIVAGCLSIAGCDRPTSSRDTARSGVPELSPIVPRDVGDLQKTLQSGDEQTDIDHLSWQTFVALNWPTRADGSADPDTPIGSHPGASRVWENYSDPVDLFKPASKQTDAPTKVTPKKNPPRFKAFYMDSKRVSRIRDPSVDAQAATGQPLIDQHGYYTVVEIRINDVEEADLRPNGIHEQGLLSDEDMAAFARSGRVLGFTPGVVPEGGGPGSVGAIELKAAWRIFPSDTPEEVLRRYHVREAQIHVPASISAKQKNGNPVGFVVPADGTTVNVGLVGLHIAHKTVNYPGWIWATFEHVDNLEIDAATNPPAGLAPTYSSTGEVDPRTDNQTTWPRATRVRGAYTTSRPKWREQPPYAVSLTEDRQWVPVVDSLGAPQLSRCPNESEPPYEVNRLWQIRLEGTVWRYYRLQVAQWADDSGKPFPQKDGVSIARNAALESYLITYEGNTYLDAQGKRWNVDAATIDLQVPVADDAKESFLSSQLIPVSGVPWPLNSENQAVRAGLLGRPTPDDGRPQQTWSSCLVCHQLARWDPPEEATGTPSVDTDYSFVIKTFLEDVRPTMAK